MYIILVYDIKQIGEFGKVQRRAFKECKKYLYHVQNSVFEGELTKVQLTKLRQELKPYIDKQEDSVIIFQSRQEKWLNKEFWGKEEDKTSFFL